MKLVDSSCLICLFTGINRPFILLDWIKQGYKIVITDQVNKELQVNESSYKQIFPEIKKGNISIDNIISDDEIATFNLRYLRLGKGESSVILEAIKCNKENKRCYAVLDDLRARKVASSLGVKLTGTYGLLLKLKEKGCITEIDFNKYLQELQKSKFRLNLEKIK